MRHTKFRHKQSQKVHVHRSNIDPKLIPGLIVSVLEADL
jgi:hypothetical protein